MKIRNKISLWIATITLAVSAASGFVVYLEMSEESYEVIDRELLDMSIRTLSTVLKDDNKQSHLSIYTDRHFVQIQSEGGDLLYQSRLAQLSEIEPQFDKTHFLTTVDISLEHLWVDPDEEDEIDELENKGILFRVFSKLVTLNGKNIVITVAKPLPFMMEELGEVRVQIILWSFVAALLVICLSYLLAGRILSPLKSINSQIKAVNQSSLSRRIPLKKSKDELYELSFALNLMFDRLQNSFERQREFIGNAAHEIKTPITTLLIGHENLMNRSISDEISDDLENQLNVLRKVSHLVKNILDISRLEQQDTLKHEVFDLAELIKDILHDFDELLTESCIKIKKDINSTQITGDRAKFKTMLINLLDNAIKYNVKHGTINITLSQTRDSTLLLISNTGLPIPEVDIPKIFDQFYRVSQFNSPPIVGFGLGLTIVKKIVDLHGGNIEVSSSTIPDFSGEQGTVITLLFPEFPDTKTKIRKRLE